MGAPTAACVTWEMTDLARGLPSAGVTFVHGCAPCPHGYRAEMVWWSPADQAARTRRGIGDYLHRRIQEADQGCEGHPPYEAGFMGSQGHGFSGERSPYPHEPSTQNPEPGAERP